MDIRKFFGPHTTVNKSAEASKSKDKTPKNKDTTPKSKDISLKNKDIAPKNKEIAPKNKDIVSKNKDIAPKNKEIAPKNKDIVSKNKDSTQKNKVTLSNSDSSKNKKQSVTDTAGKKKLSLTSSKKPAPSDEAALIIEDSSDEDVIRNSQSFSKGSRNSGNSVAKTKVKCKTSSDDEEVKHKGLSNGNKGRLGKTGQGQRKGQIDDDIDIESVNSSGSSVSGSGHGKKTKQKRGSQGEDSKHVKHDVADVRKSPRKNKNTQSNGEGKGGKPHKRKQISSEDEDSDIKIEESSDEEEEIITSRKPRKKARSKQSKKANRVLDSDSEEDPLPKDKPAAKRKKKEAVVFVDESDGEKKETALDKFIIHNPRSQPQADAKKTSHKEEVIKGKPVSVMDFFGSGTAARSDRATAVVKRKHEEVDKSADIDLTFDEEEHDDDAFLKTLDQLDGPTIKKVKHSEEGQEDTQSAQERTGSLASKLGSKMKQSAKSSPDINGNARKEDTSPVSKDTSPASKDTSPVSIDTSPVSKDTKPALKDTSPASKDTSPVSKDTSPASKDTSPVSKDTSPVSKDTKPALKDTSPASKDTSPATKDKSPATKVTKGPVKVVASSKSSAKKRFSYTMEVTKVSPAKSKIDDVEEMTPAKKAVTTPTSKGSSFKKKDTPGTDNDDGFGSKVIGGYRAFKARGGPQALGTREPPQGAENCLEGLIFVITGILDTMERDDAKVAIERHGGKVTSSISRKTSYMVVGREAGESKLSKARDMKVKQLSEDDLYDLIATQPGKTSKYETQAKEQLQKEASQKKVEEKKAAAAAQKLQAFRSEKDVKPTQVPSASSPKKESLFTQIKDSSATLKLPTAASELPAQSEMSAKDSVKTDVKSESLMWVDKHKPKNIKQIIGQQGDKSNAKKLLHWLQTWHENVLVKRLKPSGNFFGRGDGAGCRAALLSGPPGIGKTTTATLVCQEVGFSYVELNASDTRSKRSLKEVVSESLNNQTLVDYMGEHTGPPSGQTHCLIMDEVDGMAGNEDRGGLQELVQLIKTTKIPIICICNDRNSMKMRTLSNYCLDLRFQRPRVEQIKGAMMSIAFKEGVKVPPAALNEIVTASNHDIRQIIHNLSMWSAGSKTLTFEQVKQDARKAQKDVKLGPFDVCRKVFVNDEETRKMSLNDKSDLFFHDYSFGPLFVHENYLHVIPIKAQGKQTRHMQCLSQTIDSICDGDLVDRAIRKDGNWNLLPTQAMFSSVIPGEIMRGSLPQMAEFPQWLGKFSTTNKTHRILQELGTHMRLQISSDKRGLALDYLPALRSCMTLPLVSKGADGVPEVIQLMDDYDIIKEDFDNILEVTKWPNSLDPMSKLDTKTKAAFTRQYNKEAHMTPYATGVLSKKRRGKAPIDESGLEEGEGEEGAAPAADSEEEEESIEADTMIKAKKPSTSGKGKSGTPQSGKGKSGTQQSGASRGKGKGGAAVVKGKR